MIRCHLVRNQGLPDILLAPDDGQADDSTPSPAPLQFDVAMVGRESTKEDHEIIDDEQVPLQQENSLTPLLPSLTPLQPLPAYDQREDVSPAPTWNSMSPMLLQVDDGGEEKADWEPMMTTPETLLADDEAEDEDPCSWHKMPGQYCSGMHLAYSGGR